MRLLKHKMFDGISTFYSKAYLNPELALIALRRFRPRGAIEGWDYNAKQTRLQLAIDAKTHGTHIVLDDCQCNCGLALVSTRVGVTVTAVDLLAMSGHINPTTRNLVTKFVVGENMMKPMSRVGLAGNFRHWCIYCGDLGAAKFTVAGAPIDLSHICLQIRRGELLPPFEIAG